MKRLVFLILALALAVNAHAFILVGSIGQAPATTYAPNAPTSATATAGNAQNTITWTASATDGTHSAPTQYNLLWGTSTGSEPNTISNVTSGYVHSSLTNGTAYYYKVQAQNSAGTANSTEVNATPTGGSATNMAGSFNTLTSGTGAITTPGGGVAYHISTPAANDTANLVYPTAFAQTTRTFKTKFINTAMASDSGHAASYRAMTISCATSLPTSRGAAFTPNQGPDFYMQVGGGTSYHAIAYYLGADSNNYYWNGSSWQTSSANITGVAVNTTYVLTLETTSTQWRYTLRDSTDTSVITQTSWVNFSAVKNMPSTFYLFTDLTSPLAGTTTVDVNTYTYQ